MEWKTKAHGQPSLRRLMTRSSRHSPPFLCLCFGVLILAAFLPFGPSDLHELTRAAHSLDHVEKVLFQCLWLYFWNKKISHNLPKFQKISEWKHSIYQKKIIYITRLRWQGCLRTFPDIMALVFFFFYIHKLTIMVYHFLQIQFERWSRYLNCFYK